MAAIRYDCRPKPHLLSAGALPPRYHVDRLRHSPPRRLHHHGVVWMPTEPAATDPLADAPQRTMRLGAVVRHDNSPSTQR